METVIVQLKHSNAKKLLKDLESMDIIEVIEEVSSAEKKLKPSQLRGFLAKEKADEILMHVDQSRKEWS